MCIYIYVCIYITQIYNDSTVLETKTQNPVYLMHINMTKSTKIITK